MKSSLGDQSDRPFGGSSGLAPEPIEHPALNWIKLIFLILMTFGLIIMMWFIW